MQGDAASTRAPEKQPRLRAAAVFARHPLTWSSEINRKIENMKRKQVKFPIDKRLQILYLIAQQQMKNAMTGKKSPPEASESRRLLRGGAEDGMSLALERLR